MTVQDLLLEKAREYGLQSAHQAEIADTGDEDARTAAVAFAVVELVLREIADVVGEAIAA